MTPPAGPTPPASTESTAPNADRQIRRVTWLGLATNLVLSILKGVCGFAFNSQGLTADAVHSLSDCSTDVAVLVGAEFWSRPADDTHPHGHGRIETLVSLWIGVALAITALGLLWHAITTLEQGQQARPGWAAFAAALLSLIVKEALYHVTVRVSRAVHSPALRANAWHHRSDALSSIPVAAAVLGTQLAPQYDFLDPMAAVIVSVLLLRVAWTIAWPSLQQLVDAGASAEVCRQLEQIARATDGVEEVHALRTRHVGTGWHVDLHVLVDRDMTVFDGHEVSRIVHQRLRDADLDVVDVLVHIEPSIPHEPYQSTPLQ